MNFFPDPSPITLASNPNPTPGIYCRQGAAVDRAQCELDFIPFAKSSSTIVKQGGFATNTLQMQQQQQQQQKQQSHQATEERWGSGFSADDARVPRLGGSDREDSPTTGVSGLLYMPPPLAQKENMESIVQVSPSSALSYEHGCGQGNQMQALPPPTRPTAMDLGFQITPPPPLPTSMMTRTQPFSEIVVEVPPRLVANPRTRKVNRSSRLNDKYARMKSDMELIAQTSGSYHRAVRHQYDPPIHHGSPWGLTTNPPVDSTARRTFGYPSTAAVVRPTHGPSCGTQGALTQKIYGKPASFGSVNSTHGHDGGTVLSRQLEVRSTGSNSPAQHPSKRVRIDDIPVSDRVSVAGSGGGGGAFSTPHFRMSTPVRSAGVPNPTSRPPLPTQSDQADREKEDEEEDGFDDWGPGDFLLDPEAMLVPSPPQVSPYGMQRHCNINNSDRFAITTTTHLHKRPTQVTPGQDKPPLLNLGPVLLSTSFTLDHGNAAVLNERPLTLQDRIHKLGSQMRASAAATVPRFGQAPSASERERERQRVGKEYVEMGQEWDQDQQHQQYHLPQSQPRFSSNVTGIAKRTSLPAANVNSLANDLAPVPHLTDTQALLASQRLGTVMSKSDISLSDDDGFDDYKEGEESLAPDMSLLDGIEKEIQDLADF